LDKHEIQNALYEHGTWRQDIRESIQNKLIEDATLWLGASKSKNSSLSEGISALAICLRRQVR